MTKLYTGHRVDLPKAREQRDISASMVRWKLFMGHKKTCARCNKNPLEPCEEGGEILKGGLPDAVV